MGRGRTRPSWNRRGRSARRLGLALVTGLLLIAGQACSTDGGSRAGREESAGQQETQASATASEGEGTSSSRRFVAYGLDGQLRFRLFPRRNVRGVFALAARAFVLLAGQGPRVVEIDPGSGRILGERTLPNASIIVPGESAREWP